MAQGFFVTQTMQKLPFFFFAKKHFTLKSFFTKKDFPFAHLRPVNSAEISFPPTFRSPSYKKPAASNPSDSSPLH
ncbi:MAG: hypothetical protein II480_01565 [Bacteroidales bacterium]|nr:hypothetical protein [Bacteroidales bacterium]